MNGKRLFGGGTLQRSDLGFAGDELNGDVNGGFNETEIYDRCITFY